MIKPYKNRRPPRKIAWLLDHETVLLENGRRGLLSRALQRNLQVWAESELLRRLTREGHGSAVIWRSLVIGWNPDITARNWPVRGIGLPTPDNPHEVLSGLRQWRDWLQSYGAAPQGSLGGSGMSLLKATLKAPLWTNVGESPPIYYTMGGRQVAAQPIPAYYKLPLTHSDIRAAYAQTLGNMRYGGWWQKMKWDSKLERLFEKRTDMPIFIRAKMSVPDLEDTFPQLEPGERGPLVARPRKQPDLSSMLFWGIPEAYPTGRDIQGCWTWPEFQAALAAGCTCRKVLDVWFMGIPDKPFLPWLEAVWQGRSMRGFAGLLAKATGNATWGQFSIAKGRRKIVTAFGEELAPLRGGNPSQRAFDLAETICGSVRAKLYLGMLEAGPELVTAHTDGLWSRGNPIRDWRHVDDADEMRLFNAQGYAHRQAGRNWEYVAAGMLDPPTYFERTWQESLERGSPTLAEWESGRLSRARAQAVKEINLTETLAILPATCYSPPITQATGERR